MKEPDEAALGAGEADGDEIHVEAALIGDGIMKDGHGDRKGIELADEGENGVDVAGVAEVKALSDLDGVFSGQFVIGGEADDLGVEDLDVTIVQIIREMFIAIDGDACRGGGKFVPVEAPGVVGKEAGGVADVPGGVGVDALARNRSFRSRGEEESAKLGGVEDIGRGLVGEEISLDVEFQ